LSYARISAKLIPMSTRRAQPGGWSKDRRSRICRRCGDAVPKGRFTFCSAECVHQWKLRTDPAYLRAQVFARDRGVCAVCSVDTEALRCDKRKLDWRARKQFEKDWGLRRHLWDADHILPVADGGGECDLSNLRTLCLLCHRKVTAEWRKARPVAAGS
jgi:5-methylcytosine-specific restriction protein A